MGTGGVYAEASSRKDEAVTVFPAGSAAKAVNSKIPDDPGAGAERTIGFEATPMVRSFSMRSTRMLSSWLQEFRSKLKTMQKKGVTTFVQDLHNIDGCCTGNRGWDVMFFSILLNFGPIPLTGGRRRK